MFHDANGAAAYMRLAEVTYPDSRAVAYNYGTAGGTDDMLSRVASIDNDDATETYAQYAYMGASTIVAVNHPEVGAAGLLLTYDPAGDNTLTGLDRFGRVIDQLWTEGETTVDGYAYAYDPAGNRTSKTNVGNGDFSETYAYDGLDRLIDTNRDGADLQNWDLDSLGNWNSTTTADGTQTRTFDEANQITGISGGITPTYDLAGNMTAGPSPADSTTRQRYTYDAWNRLVAVYADNDGEPGALIASYAYDGQNHRVQQIAGADVTDSYYNAAWQVLEVRKDVGAAVAEQYLWDIRYVDSPVLRWHDLDNDGLVTGANETLYYTTDANMNVTALIDATTGQAVERYVYSPYGQVTVLQGTIDKDGNPTTDWVPVTGNASTVSNSVLYCGYRFDPETGLYHVRNRMYDPALGRWIQTDPAGYVDGMSLYQYVRSRPTIATDSRGLGDEFSGFSAPATLKVADGTIMVAILRYPIPAINDTGVAVVVQSTLRCDREIELVQFIHRFFDGGKSVTYRNHNNDVYNSTTDPQKPVYRTDNYFKDSALVSGDTVVRQQLEGGVFQYTFTDAPGFTVAKVEEKAIIDDFLLRKGKVIFHVHWERWKDEEGGLSYPDAQAWGKPAGSLPQWAIDTLVRDKLPNPVASQPATGPASRPGTVPPPQSGSGIGGRGVYIQIPGGPIVPYTGSQRGSLIYE